MDVPETGGGQPRCDIVGGIDVREGEQFELAQRPRMTTVTGATQRLPGQLPALFTHNSGRGEYAEMCPRRSLALVGGFGNQRFTINRRVWRIPTGKQA